MEEARSVEIMEVLVCASGVVYGAVLAYGLRQQWHWMIDPPRMDICDLLPHSGQDDLGTHTCS